MKLEDNSKPEFRDNLTYLEIEEYQNKIKIIEVENDKQRKNGDAI